MSSRIESVRRNDTVLGDIEYDRHYPLQVMHSPIMQMLASPGFSDEVSVGVPRSREARHDPSAAELAEIESEKTKEKLRNKAERVENFHRKVVERLAAERRIADATSGRRKPHQIYPTFESAFASPELSVDVVEPTLWQTSPSQNEALYYKPVQIKGRHGDSNSLSVADVEARMALSAYRNIETRDG